MAVKHFRLDDARCERLKWFFGDADRAVSGLAGQSYDPRGTGAAGDHLFAQERLSDFGNRTDVSKEAYELAIRSVMIDRAPADGIRYWTWLAAYFVPRRQDRMEFGDVASIVRFTQALRERVLEHWKYWLSKHEADRPGMTSTTVRQPTPEELTKCGDDIVYTAWHEGNKAFVDKMCAEADEMLSTCCKAYVDAEEAILKLIKQKKAADRANREADSSARISMYEDTDDEGRAA